METYCDVCGEPGATYPAMSKEGAWLCEEPVACLDRFSRLPYDDRMSIIGGEAAPHRELA